MSSGVGGWGAEGGGVGDGGRDFLEEESSWASCSQGADGSLQVEVRAWGLLGGA